MWETFRTYRFEAVVARFVLEIGTIRLRDYKFFLKNDAILIENTHKDTIFVDVKTAYLSHWHNKFWDTKPVKQ